MPVTHEELRVKYAGEPMFPPVKYSKQHYARIGQDACRTRKPSFNVGANAGPAGAMLLRMIGEERVERVDANDKLKLMDDHYHGMCVTKDAEIRRLKELHEEDMVVVSASQKLYQEMEAELAKKVKECRKLKKDKRTKKGAGAEIERLKTQVNAAAGMLSTTGDWAEKHPQDALDFIVKTADEILAQELEVTENAKTTKP